MRKRGFTLAEVLITLSIVGVIASLTIPTFVASSRNKANAAKLSAVVNAVETALTTMMAQETVSDLTETNFHSKISTNITGAIAELSKYLKITLNSTISKGATVTTKNGATLNFRFEETNATDANAQAAGFSSLGAIGTLVVDVNGNARPNSNGRDIFEFCIGKTGTLYPAGGKAYSLLKNNTGLWNNENATYSCNGKVTLGCTARLIEENYQVNY